MQITRKLIENARLQLEELIYRVPLWYQAWYDKFDSDSQEDADENSYAEFIDTLTSIDRAYKTHELFSASDALLVLSILDVLKNSELAYDDTNILGLRYVARDYTHLRIYCMRILLDYESDIMSAINRLGPKFANLLSLIDRYFSICCNGLYAAPWMLHIINNQTPVWEAACDGDEELSTLSEVLAQFKQIVMTAFIETTIDFKYINDMDLTVGFLSLNGDGWSVYGPEYKRTPCYFSDTPTALLGWLYGDISNIPTGWIYNDISNIPMEYSLEIFKDCLQILMQATIDLKGDKIECDTE